MPDGLLKLAAVPVASVNPYDPAVPANVVTFPDAITIFLMVLLSESATYRLVPSVVMPAGLLKRAAVPDPSVVPEDPAEPARVVTTEPELILPHAINKTVIEIMIPTILNLFFMMLSLQP
jgi:hypothetical protein